jgi:phosphoglycolate phosphatase-like HAD superfamily hydrolase
VVREASVILYLFDLDGTLLHAHGAGREAFDAVMTAQHGVADASTGVSYGGKTDPAIVDEIFAARLGRAATDTEHAAFLDAYLPRLKTNLAAGGVDVVEGAAFALAWLSTRPDVELGVATGNVRAGAEAKLAAAGLHAWFAAGSIGGYGCDSRVRAELVAAAIRRAREARGELREVVVVGDTLHDIAAARANGAVACAVSTGSDSAEVLAAAAPDVVWPSLKKLPAWHAARYGDGPYGP